MNTRIALSAAILATVASANADFGTFASFFDTGVTTFLRVPTVPGQGTLTASGTGYTLVSGPMTYTDVSFQLDSPLTFFTAGSAIDAPAVTDAGSFSFLKGSDVLLTITFDSATLNSNGMHASFDNGGFNDNVSFGGSIINSLVQVNGQEGFDFSFANPNDASGGKSYSSSFSASANFQAVPEPASMAALGLGALALLRRRRR